MLDVLVCCDDPLLRRSLIGVVNEEGYTVRCVENTADAVRHQLTEPSRVVVIDYAGFGMSPQEAAMVIREVSPLTQVVLIDRTDTHLEGVHILSRPVDISELKALLGHLLLKGGLYDTQTDHTEGI